MRLKQEGSAEHNESMEDNANNIGQQKVDGSEWTSTIRKDTKDTTSTHCAERTCSSLTFSYEYL